MTYSYWTVSGLSLFLGLPHTSDGPRLNSLDGGCQNNSRDMSAISTTTKKKKTSCTLCLIFSVTTIRRDGHLCCSFVIRKDLALIWQQLSVLLLRRCIFTNNFPALKKEIQLSENSNLDMDQMKYLRDGRLLESSALSVFLFTKGINKGLLTSSPLHPALSHSYTHVCLTYTNRRNLSACLLHYKQELPPLWTHLWKRLDFSFFFLFNGPSTYLQAIFLKQRFYTDN